MTNQKMKTMIDIDNVSKWYGKFAVLTDCSTRIGEGEVVVVCGPSGSGKSTLIKTVNALEPIQRGGIMVNGIAVTDPKTDLPKLRSRVGMVFQHFELFGKQRGHSNQHVFHAARGRHPLRDIEG